MLTSGLLIPEGNCSTLRMADQVDADFIEEGFMFDGSSIAGWKSIEASDMKLMIDTDSAYVDPFYAEKLYTFMLGC